MFTSSKLKALMPLIHQSGKKFKSYAENFDEEHVDCKEIMQRFAIEILGSLGCGITPDVLTKENSQFYDEVYLSFLEM